jgi:hypothetical protein
MNMHKTFKYGLQNLLLVEGEVLESREWQESRVQTERHLGGGWSIGTDVSHHGKFWLKLDSGQELPVEGAGGFDLRQGHRVRVLGIDGTHFRAVALLNISTQMQQYDDAAARAVWQSGWWRAGALLMGLAGIVLLLLGLLLWAFSNRHGVFYLVPSVAVFALGVLLEGKRKQRFRNFVWRAME